MMEATKQMLGELGVPRERIKTEAFGPALGKEERPPGMPGITQPPAEAAAIDDRGAEAPVATVAIPTVTFTESDKSATLPPGKSVLEVAEEIGVDIDYSCRAGTCGVCRVKLLSGEVSMAVTEGLQPADKENGIILACQAKAVPGKGNIEVQA
jgi:ferredoxin